MHVTSLFKEVEGAGLIAGDNSIVDLRGTISFIDNYIDKFCGFGGGIHITNIAQCISAELVTL